MKTERKNRRENLDAVRERERVSEFPESDFSSNTMLDDS
jgi:hypothetical protein